MRAEDEAELLSAAAGGSADARGRLLAGCRERLKRAVRARLDPRVSARVDSSDVVQDALADADRGLDEYLDTRPVAFYPWVRGIAERRVIDLHRRHLHAAKRSVRRESPPAAESGSADPARHWLAADQTSPSQQVVRAEELLALRAGLEQLSDDDREVIVLRYVEQLSMPEVAEVLSIGLPAAKSRHLRAVARLTAIVKGDHPGGG